MKYTILIALLAVAACSPPDERPTEDTGGSTADVRQPQDAGPQEDSGDEDAGPDEEDMHVPFGEVPDAISSAGARFAGRLPAGGDIAIDLTVFQGDKVTMWLRQAGGTEWDPSINVFRMNDPDPIVFGNPSGNEDAHIPFQQGQLDEGFEFFYSGTYRMELENRGSADGEFEFSLECRGGPCGVASGDVDFDGVEDGSDACPYYPGESCDQDPWAGDSNAALEDGIRGDHTGHVELNYVEARVHMFAWIDNEDGEVEGVYTGDRVPTVEIPDSTEMNTEHTWPQSRSGGDPATESDLHHLFGTAPDANEARGSLHFGEVVSSSWERGGSQAGDDASNNAVFEPRDEHKGNVARAMFYYAVVYGQDIPAYEESALRQWHVDDPVDDPERRRNQSIANIQGSRNPFVDFPELVDRIDDF